MKRGLSVVEDVLRALQSRFCPKLLHSASEQFVVPRLFVVDSACRQEPAVLFFFFDDALVDHLVFGRYVTATRYSESDLLPCFCGLNTMRLVQCVLLRFVCDLLR